MKIERIDGSRERKILTGMIVDHTILGRISSKWDKGLFNSKWSNMIGQWCVDYYKKYERAPNKAIEGLFENWSEESKDTATIELIEKYLDSLSGEYRKHSKEINADYIMDMASEYFNRVRLTRLKDSLEGDIDSGDITKSFKRIDNFGKIELATTDGVDVFQDYEMLKAAFQQKKDPLIRYKDALGMFFGHHLEREGFIAAMAPEKTGKTAWLLDFAWRGMNQGRKVAFFGVGDMTMRQMIVDRIAVRAAKHPMNSSNGKWPVVAKFPTFLEEGNKWAKVTYAEKTFYKPLQLKEAWRAFKKITGGELESNFRISCHPNDSINVTGISNILSSWEREGYVADVVVIDYADILAPPAGNMEGRDAINKTWKQLRALSQSKHCLVITATQTDSAAYDVELLTRSNFSEDKRKYAHVTGIFGINVTPEEKDSGVFRLNWLFLREGMFSLKKCVHVASCLDIANPAVKSMFWDGWGSNAEKVKKHKGRKE